MSNLVPRDLPLPLPAPAWLLEFLLVSSFMLHILFVNLMVGGSLFTVFYQWKGKTDQRFEELAYLVAKTLTVNKSLAVVLGVGPLLCLNVLYTTFFYSANALTGTAWLMIIPLISGAFLLTYLHKYTWHNNSLSRGSHRLIAIFAAILFLIIPFIFLANANLMLFPERWGEVKGFFTALLLPNVFPRYLHFIAASVTVTGLFLIGYLGRNKDPSSIFKREPNFLFEARRSLYSLCFVITAAQFIIGPLVLFTLPSHGISGAMLGFLLIAIAMAMVLLKFLYQESKNPTPQLSKGFLRIVFLFTVIVAFMVSIRHMYREQALSAHKQIQKEKTQAFLDESAAAAIQAKSPVAEVSPQEKGKNAFASYCSGCHAEATVKVGPALTEIRGIYKTDTAGIVKWAKAPGKKRPGMAMPSMNHVQEDDLDAIAHWILKAK